MLVRIGTSGWQYADWRGAFYPAEVAQRHWLEYYAARFATVEVNNAFYRLPSAEVFAAWATRTPEDFCVAVKASRFLTHIKRLRDPEEPVTRLLERCRHLGDKLGPVLLQLPPTLRIDLTALRETLAAFPAGVRVAVEPRHESWFVDKTADLLAEFDAAYCLADAPNRTAPRWCTASFAYVRFHSGVGRPRPCYAASQLRGWAEWLARAIPDSHDVFAYFNNDPGGCAPHDAVRFAAEARHAGLAVTRTPSRREAPLADARQRP